MASISDPSRLVITFLGEREELAKIEAVFTELKLITGLKKVELYGKALEWIANNEIAKQKFIEYLLNKKAKNEMIEIVK
jgi:nicotinic acid phosphoribosyltransferase